MSNDEEQETETPEEKLGPRFDLRDGIGKEDFQ